MSSIRLSITLVLFAGAAHQAAADVCVSCSGPSATYLCNVKRAEEIETFAGAKALNKICTKVLKRSGAHASCQVLDVGSTKCPGVPKLVGWKEVKEALAGGDDSEKPAKEPAAAAKSTVASPPPATKPAPPSGKTPDSSYATGSVKPPPVADAPAADKPPEHAAAEASPSLGDNIKNAAEKTWSCVSSLFGKC